VLRERFPDVEVQEARAESLPFGAGEFDLSLAQLVVGFVSDAPAAVAEMARVARRLAVCMWGIAEVDMFRAIDETAEAIGATRGGEPRRYRTPQTINELLAPHGEVESAALDVTRATGTSRSSGTRWVAASVPPASGSPRSTPNSGSARTRSCPGGSAILRGRSS